MWGEKKGSEVHGGDIDVIIVVPCAFGDSVRLGAARHGAVRCRAVLGFGVSGFVGFTGVYRAYCIGQR